MTTTTTTETKTKKSLKPNRLLLKPEEITQIVLKSDIASPVIAMPTIPSSPIATGSFYLPLPPLPIKQKNNRKGRYHQKHLRKPPSFDTYIHSSTSSTTTTPCGYLRRTSSSISSSYSSTSSLADNEDVYGYGYKSNNHSTTSVHSPRLRRGSSAFKVRFAEDDGSSIVSSSSGGSDWDDIIDDEEEEYIFVPQQPPQHFFNYHNKSEST